MSLLDYAAVRRALSAVGIVLALAAIPLRAQDDDLRFSATLRPEQWTEIGLNKLTTDNVAVIDALVRADKTASEYRNNNIASTRFSQRRNEHERTISGLYVLTPEQLQKLDDFVALRLAPPTAQLETPVPAPRLTMENTMATPRGPEIHGSFSLTYGGGKGGSFRGANSTFTYDDPAHGFSMLFSYSEYKGKGYYPLIYPGAGLYPYPYSPYPYLAAPLLPPGQ
jgi:hypothetical protein